MHFQIANFMIQKKIYCLRSFASSISFVRRVFDRFRFDLIHAECEDRG